MAIYPALTGPFDESIWIARIEGLKSHLRIIWLDGENSDHRGMERMARQAFVGIAEADRYLAEPNWDACSMEERTAR